MKKIVYIVWCFVFCVWCLATFTSCRNEQVSSDPSLRLIFSVDTLRFDTVFTTLGSATKSVTLYNRNSNAIVIDKVTQDKQKYFYINFDGETQLSKMGGQINGGDSLILFVRVNIDPQDATSPVLVEDMLRFEVNGNSYPLALEAYGQDVEKISSPTRCTTYDNVTFTAEKPYLIYDTVRVTQSLVMNAGARLYFHQGGTLIVEGDALIGESNGAPIRCISDRIDNLFDKVPYAYAAGGWNGIYLLRKKDAPVHSYTLHNLEVVSGTNGLQCINEDSLPPYPKVEMNACCVHNQAGNGLTLRYMDANVTNTELSNCAGYCAYLLGGEQTFVHTTFASFFGSTNVRIQSVGRLVDNAVLVDNTDSLMDYKASFINCVIAGLGKENLVFARPIDSTYAGTIVGNYIQAPTDTAKIFVNTYFEYQKYDYYDFHLAPMSPARGIADSAMAIPYAVDRDGLARDASHPSAGCYEK